MHTWLFVFFLTAQKLSLSSSHYHVLVADDQRPFADASSNTLFSHLRHRRSLAQPNEILSSLTEYEGSGGDESEDEAGEIQEFQFFMKNNDTVNSARTTISEMMPGNAILMDFSIHNEGKTYRYNKHLARNVEEAGVEFQDSVSSGLSVVMLGDVRTSAERCSDCRTDDSEPSEAVAAVINVAPGDILSVSLSYKVPRNAGRVVENEKEIYRTDATIDLDESARNFTGVIMSPNYPADYPNSADLTWLINAPSTDMVISSKIISFSTEACCDHLYIYDGPTDTYPLIYVISGDVSNQQTINTTRSSMLVKFQTDSLVTAGGFALEFHPTMPPIPEEEQIDEDKTGPANETMVLLDSFGIIKTPYYPEFYPASSTLVWEIMVESNYTIDLHFIDFDIFEGETLEIMDMDTKKVYVTLDCDTNTPNNFNVSSNEVQLVFHSLDRVIPKRGIYAKYFSRQAEEIFILSSDAEWHTINSPYYPHDYSSNQHLVWIVTVDDPTSLVRIEIVSLNLERGYDFLVMYSGTSIDDSNKLATLSGSHGQDIEYMSKESSATIAFHSDRSITDTGFQLRFRNYMVNTNCFSAADVIQGWPSGTVRNAAFPSNNYFTHDCQWLIVVKETKVISTFVEKFWRQHTYMDLTFYDGDSGSYPVLLSTGGANINNAVSLISSSNKMLVVFDSYGSYNAQFAFRFQEVDITDYPTCHPDTVYDVAPGQITNPKYPLNPPGGVCSWLIQAPSGYQVLVAVKFYFTNGNINFYDGNLATDRLITNCQYCGNTDYEIRSTSNSMLIQATSGRFKFEYEFVSGSTSLMNREIGSATSPSFPDAYPENSYEVINIRVDSGVVAFYFETFETEECCDVLNIYDGDSTSSPTIAALKGNHQGFQAQTNGRYLTLEFSSDDSVSGSGFKMDYCSTTEDCKFSDSRNSAYSYHLLTLDNDYYLGSPSASGYYPILTDFYWYLECPSFTVRIKYDFERLDLDYTDSMILYNDFSMSDDSVALRYSQRANDYYYGYSLYGVAPRNLLWFHSDPSFTGMGFYLSYSCETS